MSYTLKCPPPQVSYAGDNSIKEGPAPSPEKNTCQRDSPTIPAKAIPIACAYKNAAKVVMAAFAVRAHAEERGTIEYQT